MMSNIFSSLNGEGRSISSTPLLHPDWRRRETAAFLAREALPQNMLSPEPAIVAQIWTILGEGVNGAGSSDSLAEEIASGDKAALALTRKICMLTRHAWDSEKALTDCLRELERRQTCRKREQQPVDPGELDAEEQRYFDLLSLEDKYIGARETFQELALAWGRMADLLSGQGSGRLEEIARSSLSLRYSLSYACEVQRARLLQLATFAQQRIVECQWERMDQFPPPGEETNPSSESREEEGAEEQNGPKLFGISDEE